MATPPSSADASPVEDRRRSRRLGAFNAWFLDTSFSYASFISRHHKRAAFDSIEPGRILEIGAGAGANFGYLPPGSKLIALEPNSAMHRRLQRRAGEHDIDLELLVAPAENIPLEDNSIDTVISTLVLCTVDDPDRVLREIKRVLRPGGTLRFVEHVAAKPMSPRRWLQRAISRPWAWVFEGCQLCRNTDLTISEAGFSSLQVQRRRLSQSVVVPVNSAIHGIATK